jgi:two-component system chemotaxis response regulator CheY
MKTVMVVDDSPSVLQMIAVVLRARGFQVLEAENACQALQLADQHHVDLVLTDLLMPCLNGIELIAGLRKRADFGKVPIVMVTTQSAVELKIAGQAAGASAWIDRPFSTEHLLAVIHGQLPG